jgi:O-methyltransferase involved in polyketide biosynthesis
MDQKISVKRGTVEETLLLPLWGRAVETNKGNPRLIDKKAVNILNQLDYDFNTITQNMNPVSQHGWVARSLHTDRIVTGFIKKHPEATIINIGCGMDTTFDRVDNGKIMFYELDLPDVIELRKSFFHDSERHKSISSSFLNSEWYQEIQVTDALLCIAGGVFYYFEEAQIKTFFMGMADHFKRCDFCFDSLSPMGVKIANKKVLKAGGMSSALGKWKLKSIKSLEKWDKRIKILEIIPMYKEMKKGIPLLEKMGLIFVDIFGIGSMVYMRIE